MAALYELASFFSILAASAGRVRKHCNGDLSSGLAAGPHPDIDANERPSDFAQWEKGSTSAKPHLYLVADALRELAESYTRPLCPLKWQGRRRGGGSSGRLTPRQLARKARLSRGFSEATTYKEKRRISKQLYELEFESDIEAQNRAGLFDAEIVKTHLCRLENALKRDNVTEMLSIVQNDISRDLGGICNPALYHHFGSKAEPLIDRYQKAVIAALQRIVAVCRAEDHRLDKGEVKNILQETCG